MLPLSLRYVLSLMLVALHYFLAVIITPIITTTITTTNNSSSIKIDYKDKAHWMFRLQRTIILSTHPFIRFPIFPFYL